MSNGRIKTGPRMVPMTADFLNGLGSQARVIVLPPDEDTGKDKAVKAAYGIALAVLAGMATYFTLYGLGVVGGRPTKMSSSR